MKKFNKTGPMRLRRVIGNLLTQRRIITILAVAAGLLPASNAFGNEINLVTPYPGSGFFGFGTYPPRGGPPEGNNPSGAIYSTIDSQPTGTGVFQPFLSYQANGVEEGFNTSQGGPGQGFLDTKRVPQWNHDLHVGELAIVTGPNGTGSYYAFELDANETGNGNANRLLSIDDIRIYTSSTDTANSVGDGANINDLGTIRYAQNFDDMLPGGGLGITANWVLIDASRSEGGSTSGSGSSDMILYVPTALFAGADVNDFLYFYTINGVHESSDAGFEEWKAYTATGVPDGGSTLLLLGSALTALGFLAGRRGLAVHA